MSLKNYIVSIPITGAAHIRVRAEDISGAIQEAWSRIDSGDFEPNDDNIEWEYTEAVTTGNVCHAFQITTEVNEVDE